MTKKETASDKKHTTPPSHRSFAEPVDHSPEPAAAVEAPAPKHVPEAAGCQATSNRGACGEHFGHAGHHRAKDNSHTWSQ